MHFFREITGGAVLSSVGPHEVKFFPLNLKYMFCTNFAMMLHTLSRRCLRLPTVHRGFLRTDSMRD
jgi:hypothetical protein